MIVIIAVKSWRRWMWADLAWCRLEVIECDELLWVTSLAGSEQRGWREHRERRPSGGKLNWGELRRKSELLHFTAVFNSAIANDHHRLAGLASHVPLLEPGFCRTQYCYSVPVCRLLVLYRNDCTYRQTFSSVWWDHHSSFPTLTTSQWEGVCTTGRFGKIPNFRHLAISRKRYKIELKSLWNINRRSYSLLNHAISDDL